MNYVPQVALPGQQPAQPAAPAMYAGTVPMQYGPQVPVNGQYMVPQPAQAVPAQPAQPAAAAAHPTLGWLPTQPTAAPAPVVAPTAAQAVRAQFNGGEILDGPGIPQELRGRRVADVMGIYGKLIDHYSKTRAVAPAVPGQPAAVAAIPGQPAAPAQYAAPGQPLPPPAAPTQQNSFMTSMQQMVKQAVGEAVGPMQAATHQTQARAVEADASTRIPDFHLIREDLMGIISTAAPEHQANPAFWDESANLARGRFYGRQMAANPAAAPSAAPPAAMSTYAQPYGYQPQMNGIPSVPAAQPQPHQYFTESPTPPAVYGQPYMGGLTPAQQEAAKGFGMEDAEYQAWSQPVAPQGAARRY